MQLGCACAWSPLGTSHIPVKSLEYELPQGYVRDSTLAEDLFLYCFTVRLYGHLGFLQQIKKVKIKLHISFNKGCTHQHFEFYIQATMPKYKVFPLVS